MAPYISDDNGPVVKAYLSQSYQKKVDAPPMGVSYMNIGQHYSDKINQIGTQQKRKVFKPRMYHYNPKHNYD